MSVAAGCSSSAEVGEDEAEAADSNLDLSNDPGALIKAPLYFSMPKTALSGPLARDKYSYSTLWNPSTDPGASALGLRIIAVPEKGGAGTSVRRAVRKQMTKELAVAGVLQDGDVVLSFRPNLAETMAYPHIQMGSTHAGMVFTKGTGDAVESFNLDQPLDGDYNVVEGGTKFVGKFDSKHYVGCEASDTASPAFKCKKNDRGEWVPEAGAEALHILRPRNLTPERKENLRGWVEVLGRKHAQLRDAGALNFNSDYLKPLLANRAYGHSVQKQVTKLGKILLGLETPPQDFDMFCSELVFHLQTLAACTQDQIRAAGDAAECASNAAMPFVPMKLVDEQYAGLADGPLQNLLALRAERADNERFVKAIFAEGAGATRLSSGHRAVATAVAPLMGQVEAYYKDRLGIPREMPAGAPPPVAFLEGATQGLRNYSPTAYLVNAALPTAHPMRSIDYVATVVFTPAAGVEKARRLARNPQP
jgi:hypothetical protein